MTIKAGICFSILLLILGIPAYLSLTKNTHADRMKERDSVAGKSQVSHVNGVPVGYMWIFIFLFTLFCILSGWINGEL
jgi:hypothetical protein